MTECVDVTVVVVVAAAATAAVVFLENFQGAEGVFGLI